MDRAELTPRFKFKLGDLGDTLVRLDTIVLGAWAPNLLGMDFDNRGFAYFGGAHRDGAGVVTPVGGFPDDGVIICPDDQESIVQRDTEGVVTVEDTLDRNKFAMAWVKCEGGLLTEFEDIRDLGIVQERTDRFGWRTIRITTAQLHNYEYEEGSVALANVTTLMEAAATVPSWLRLYASAADRAADAGRNIDAAAPAGRILLEVVFPAANDDILLSTRHGLGVLAQDDCGNALATLYWRIDLLPGSSSFVFFGRTFEGAPHTWPDPPEDTIPQPEPEFLGTLQTTGGPTYTAQDIQESYFVQINSTGDPSELFGGLQPTGSPTPLVWTSYGKIDHSSLNYGVRNLYQLGVDDSGHFFYLCALMPDDPIVAPWSGVYGDGNFDNSRYLYAGAVRTGSGSYRAELGWVEPDGTATLLDSVSGLSWPLDSSIAMELQIRGDQATLLIDGTAVCTATIPAQILTPCNNLLGLHASRALVSAGYIAFDIYAERGDLVPVTIDLLAMERSGNLSAANTGTGAQAGGTVTAGGGSMVVGDGTGDDDVTGVAGPASGVTPGGVAVPPLNKPLGYPAVNADGGAGSFFREAFEGISWTELDPVTLQTITKWLDDIGWEALDLIDPADFVTSVLTRPLATALASTNPSDVALALDGDTGTGWQAGHLMRNTDALVLDLKLDGTGALRRIGAVRLRNVAHSGQEPPVVQVLTYVEPNTRALVAGRAIIGPSDDCYLQLMANIEARYLLLAISPDIATGLFPLEQWAVDELEVYAYDEGTPYAPPAPAAGWLYTFPIIGTRVANGEGLTPYWADLGGTPAAADIRYATGGESTGYTLPSGAVGWLVMSTFPVTFRDPPGLSPIARKDLLVPHYGVLASGLPAGAWRLELVDDATALPSGAFRWLSARTTEGDTVLIPQYPAVTRRTTTP